MEQKEEMKCKYCGRRWRPQRSTGQYCCPKCRVYAWRKRLNKKIEKEFVPLMYKGKKVGGGFVKLRRKGVPIIKDIK